MTSGRYAIILASAATLAVAGCSVEKKADAGTDTAAVTPAPQVAAPDTATATPPATSVDTARKTGATPAKSNSKSGTDNRMRDSATQPKLEIGADGKVRPVKKY